MRVLVKHYFQCVVFHFKLINQLKFYKIEFGLKCFLPLWESDLPIPILKIENRLALLCNGNWNSERQKNTLSFRLLLSFFFLFRVMMMESRKKDGLSVKLLFILAWKQMVALYITPRKIAVTKHSTSFTSSWNSKLSRVQYRGSAYDTSSQ